MKAESGVTEQTPEEGSYKAAKKRERDGQAWNYQGKPPPNAEIGDSWRSLSTGDFFCGSALSALMVICKRKT